MNYSDYHIKVEDTSIVLWKENSVILSSTLKEIKSIKVFKRDLITEDLICMELINKTNYSFEINEEMNGWDDFTKSLSQILQNCISIDKWFSEVTKTPFSTKRIEIYNSKKVAV